MKHFKQQIRQECLLLLTGHLGSPLIAKPPQTFEELQKRQKEIEENRNGFSWYLSFANPEENKDKESCNRKVEDKNDK